MSKLDELGLSSYEARAYRALVSLGGGTARAVSDASGVPEGRIYDALNGLVARDLVRTRETEPTTYVPVDPERALDRLLAERKRELDERAARYERLAAEAAAELTATAPTESQFWTAELGSDTAVSLAATLYGEADESVRSAMSVPYEAVDWETYAAEIDASLDGVVDTSTARVLVTPGVLDGVPEQVRDEYTDSPPTVEIRTTTELRITFDDVWARARPLG